jgi:hypothetical protein
MLGLRLLIRITLLAVSLAITAAPSLARTPILDGHLTSSLHVKDTAVLELPPDAGGIDELTYHLVPPASVVTITSNKDRAAGIPARLVQGRTQGKSFVSTRFIRIEVGPDTAAVHTDGLIRWRARSTARPTLMDVHVETTFTNDTDIVHAQHVASEPKNLVYGAHGMTAPPATSMSPPMPQPVTQLLPSPAQPALFAGGPPLGPASPPTRTAPALGPTQTLRPEDFTFPVAFGNLEFPHEIRLDGPVSPSGNERYALEQNGRNRRARQGPNLLCPGLRS